MTHDLSGMTKCTQAREFPFARLLPLLICLFFLYLLPGFLPGRGGSLISPLEASIQPLVRLSTDITNFTFHPFPASSGAMTTAARQRVPHSSPLSDPPCRYPGSFFLPSRDGRRRESRGLLRERAMDAPYTWRTDRCARAHSLMIAIEISFISGASRDRRIKDDDARTISDNEMRDLFFSFLNRSIGCSRFFISTRKREPSIFRQNYLPLRTRGEQQQRQPNSHE